MMRDTLGCSMASVNSVVDDTRTIDAGGDGTDGCSGDGDGTAGEGEMDGGTLEDASQLRIPLYDAELPGSASEASSTVQHLHQL